MRGIERLLGGDASGEAPCRLRPPEPGDIGWVVERHGAVYAEEYGFDASFEALVAEIAATFIRRFDPERERCWIAERAGERVGSVFVVKRSPQVAKLRLLLVERQARGLGLAKLLVEECVALCSRGGLPQARPLDAEHPAAGPAHLRGRRLPPQALDAAPQLRPGPHRRALGDAALEGWAGARLIGTVWLLRLPCNR